jgi:hypothetical protein
MDPPPLVWRKKKMCSSDKVIIATFTHVGGDTLFLSTGHRALHLLLDFQHVKVAYLGHRSLHLRSDIPLYVDAAQTVILITYVCFS